MKHIIYKLGQLFHFVIRWGVAALATLLLSNIANTAHAAGLKTLSFVLDKGLLEPNFRVQDYTSGFNTSYIAGDVDPNTVYFSQPLEIIDSSSRVPGADKGVHGVKLDSFGAAYQLVKQLYRINN